MSATFREWLEQQAVAGIVRVANPFADAAERLFALPGPAAEVLANPESLDYLAPVGQLLAGLLGPLDQVLEAYRTGNGVPYHAYGRNMVEGQARMNRAPFLYQLGQEWIASVPGLRERLMSDPPARVADIGCGAGWSAIGLARCYPKIRADGFDFDLESIRLAGLNAAEAGVSGRVRFRQTDASDGRIAGEYDLVMALECVHDMNDPVAALRTMRSLAKPEGAVFIMDERVADRFEPDAGGLEWLMYGCSVLHCLPVSMCPPGRAGTGTVMRPETLRRYASQAGFASFTVLDIEHPMFRFYLLR